MHANPIPHQHTPPDAHQSQRRPWIHATPPQSVRRPMEPGASGSHSARFNATRGESAISRGIDPQSLTFQTPCVGANNSQSSASTRSYARTQQSDSSTRASPSDVSFTVSPFTQSQPPATATSTPAHSDSDNDIEMREVRSTAASHRSESYNGIAHAYSEGRRAFTPLGQQMPSPNSTVGVASITPTQSMSLAENQNSV